MNNKCAIYKISFSGCDRPYFGSTMNYQRRKSQHLYRLRRNNHDNKKLQNAFNKYGEGSFIFEVIETFIEEDYDLVRQREQEYLNNYFAQEYIKSNFTDKRFDSLLLNVTPEVDLMRVHWTAKRKQALIDRNKTFVWTNEMKNHMRTLKTGLSHSLETKEKCRISVKKAKDKIKFIEKRECIYCKSYDLVKLGFRYNKTKKVNNRRFRCNACKKFHQVLVNTTGQLVSDN